MIDADEMQGQPRSLPLRSAYKLLEDHGFAPEAAVLRVADPGKGLAKIPRRRAKRGMALEVLRAKGLFDKFLADYWHNGATPDGERRIASYDSLYAVTKTKTEIDEEEAEESNGDADRFVYEKELQNYLAKNPGLLEPGMTLWDVGDGQSATEFQVDEKGRRIDILAKDKSGVPVVIELKVDRGHEKVIGQALYYRECVKAKLNVLSARIIIIAREISPELRIALKAVSDVTLFEYRLSMTLTRI